MMKINGVSLIAETMPITMPWYGAGITRASTRIASIKSASTCP
jgi:hypothetical protein